MQGTSYHIIMWTLNMQAKMICTNKLEIYVVMADYDTPWLRQLSQVIPVLCILLELRIKVTNKGSPA